MRENNLKNENIQTIAPEELEMICRSCLNKNGTHNIFQTKYKETFLRDLFVLFCKVDINEHDGLPQRVCDLCAHFLVQLYIFKQKVQHSLLTLETALDIENPALNKTKKTAQDSPKFYRNSNYNESLTEDDNEFDLNTEDLSGSFTKSEFVEEFNDCLIQMKIDNSKTFTCSFCCIKFTSESIYNLHAEKENEIRAETKCLICEQLINKYILRDHLNEHAKNEELICKICSTKFSTIGHFSKHFPIHFDGTTEHCHICGKTLSKTSHLEDHIRSHIGEKILACNICDQKFETRYALNSHKYFHKIENGEIQPQVCKICKKTVKRGRLKTHMLMHSSEKELCSECGKTFSNSANLRRHLETVHRKRKPYSCSMCNKSFSQSSSLKNHMMVVHSEERPYLCSTCGKRFSQQSTLKYHMERKHSQNIIPRRKNPKLKFIHKLVACMYCNKTFDRLHGLKIHMQQHSKSRPFSCHLCHRTFIQRNSLKIHMQYHDEGILFTCDLCSKTFISSVALKLHHVKKHTNKQTYYKEKGVENDVKKEFACTICPRRFMYKWNLKKHIKFHSKQNQLSCDVCFKIFEDSDSMELHKRTTHEENYVVGYSE